MGYSDVTRLAGNLSSESLQSLRKTQKNRTERSSANADSVDSAKSSQNTFQAELQNTVSGTTVPANTAIPQKAEGSVILDIQGQESKPPVMQSSRIRSPELAEDVVQELRDHILANTAQALLAQANFSSRTLLRLQR